jgi:hypothetical protein
MSSRSEKLSEALEDAALAGALEIKEFLGTYRGKDPDRLKRVQVAVGAVSGYTRWRASQNNMVSMMLMAARQTGVSAEDTLNIAKVAGLIPAGAEVSERLKLAK